MPPGEIETRLVREAVAAQGITPAELARRMDWRKMKTDTARARRILGITPDTGAPLPRQRMVYEKAVAICEACGIDPVDVGA